MQLLDRPLLVLAGAGSGKTRVITEKIHHLIRSGYDPRSLIAVTFTNKAAREMKERVAQHCHERKIRGLRISTFHSLGLDILRKEHQALGLKPNLSILDETDKLKILQEILAHGKLKLEPDQIKPLAGHIGRWKNAATLPPAALNDAQTDFESSCALVYDAYARYCLACNAVDFDDLILLPNQLFEQHPDILEQWRLRTRYLLVDEYQDTNRTQYDLICRLTGPLGAFTVVGDDDQSIYAWRGAETENLLHLKRDYPRLEVIKLEQNYRSNQRILRVANQLISNNPHLFEKKLWSQIHAGEPIRVIRCKNEVGESQQIGAEIQRMKVLHGRRNQDFAVLYRSNHQSRLLEKTLRELDLPYKLSGGTSFFAHSEVKDVIAYLKLMTNQDDNSAFLRIINTPRREIGPGTIEKLAHYANQRHISLFDACSEFGLQQHLPARAIKHLQGFCDWLLKLAEQADQSDPIAAIHSLLNDIDYQDWLRQNSSSEKQAERRYGNVMELIEWLHNTLKKKRQPQSLADLISHVLLMDTLDQQAQEQETEQIRLMTLHAAKGLEFPVVFIIGMEENLIPHQNSQQTEQIEEERRLAYVGMTRAKEQLILSYCRQRNRRGEQEPCDPSRFLFELPKEDLEWDALTPTDPEKQKQKGQENLALLKNLLQ